MLFLVFIMLQLFLNIQAYTKVYRNPYGFLTRHAIPGPKEAGDKAEAEMVKLIIQAVDEGREDDLIKAGLKITKLANTPRCCTAKCAVCLSPRLLFFLATPHPFPPSLFSPVLFLLSSAETCHNNPSQLHPNPSSHPREALDRLINDPLVSARILGDKPTPEEVDIMNAITNALQSDVTVST